MCGVEMSRRTLPEPQRCCSGDVPLSEMRQGEERRGTSGCGGGEGGAAVSRNSGGPASGVGAPSGGGGASAGAASGVRCGARSGHAGERVVQDGEPGRGPGLPALLLSL